MNPSKTSLIRRLKSVKTEEYRNHGRSLKWYVANYALKRYGDSDNELNGFFCDLLSHGCICGMVTPLVWYSDTRQFFDRFYHDIEDLRHEQEESIGQPVPIRNDLKNDLAWFGFEETAYRLYTEDLGQEW